MAVNIEIHSFLCYSRLVFLVNLYYNPWQRFCCIWEEPSVLSKLQAALIFSSDGLIDDEVMTKSWG